MNYLNLATTIDKDLLESVKLINNPEVSPTVRQRNFEILFREVGEAVYDMIYDMASFDFDIAGTIGAGIDANRYYGLAKVASDAIVTGDDVQSAVKLWLDDVIGKASSDAFYTATDLGKHPTLTRTEMPNCCKWCSMHVGTFIDPEREAFRRHENCRAKIVVSGYKTRNGELKNYKKPKERS